MRDYFINGFWKEAGTPSYEEIQGEANKPIPGENKETYTPLLKKPFADLSAKGSAIKQKTDQDNTARIYREKLQTHLKTLDKALSTKDKEAVGEEE